MRNLLLVLALLAAGCGTQVIAVPPGAPLRLSENVALKNPYVRVGGQWVQKTGTVTGYAGQVLLTLPVTTQPAN